MVKRHDIDGVHIDDYFYPYPVQLPAGSGTDLPFPDEESDPRDRLGGGQQPHDDRRRASVDSRVAWIYTVVHGVKPWMCVGISRFGTGKPERRPPGITGFSQCDWLYADVERWLTEGWLDNLAQALYWPIDRPGQQFPVLLDHWTVSSLPRWFSDCCMRVVARSMSRTGDSERFGRAPALASAQRFSAWRIGR